MAQRYIINGRFITQQVTGVQRYARELVRALDKMAGPGELELAVPPETFGAGSVRGPGITDALPALKNIEIKAVGRVHDKLWEHISLPAYAAKTGRTVLNLCNTAPLPAPGISTIHDLKVIVHPEYYSRAFRAWYHILFANEMRRSVRILTGTEFSKKEILRYYRVSPRRIHVISEGWQHFQRISCDEGACGKFGLKAGAFFFSMSSLDPNKNFAWIAEQAKLQPDRVFAIAGAVNRNVFGESGISGYPENVKFLGYISDGEARALMRDCTAFLFPSFYEGFGLPPLEALSAGCRCIVVSDTPVMHEIFEDQAVYVDPDRAALFTPVPAADPGRILNKYSWDRSARKLLNVLRGT